MDLMALVMLAIVIEGLVGYTKSLFYEKKLQWPVIIAMTLGMISAVMYDVDLFSKFDMETRVPYVGNVLTGLLLARGSNYIADLLHTLTCHKTVLHEKIREIEESHAANDNR